MWSVGCRVQGVGCTVSGLVRVEGVRVKGNKQLISLKLDISHQGSTTETKSTTRARSGAIVARSSSGCGN